MPWGRVSDDAFTYPKLLAVAGIPGAPDYAVNEVFGFFQACILQSAAHVTDYVINKGAVQTAGRSRWKKVLAWSERVGLLTPIEIDGMEHWLLVNDPKFIHIRTQAELDAEAFTRDVRSKPELAAAVLLRDGDNCRYCLVFVHYDGTKSNRSLTFDHRNPGQPAETPDDLVVACRTCNTARQNNVGDWDTSHPLHPAPAQPNYGKNTAAYLTKHGRPTEPNVEPDAKAHRSSTQQQPTPGSAGSSATASRGSATATIEHAVTGPEVATHSPPTRDPRSIGTSSAGSGRAGPGPGQAPGPGPGAQRTRKRKRKRGTRGGSGSTTSTTSTTGTQHRETQSAVPCCAQPFPHREDDGSIVCLTCDTTTRETR